MAEGQTLQRPVHTEERIKHLASESVEKEDQTIPHSPDRVTDHDNDDSHEKTANTRKEPNVTSRVSTGKVFMARESLLTELLETPHIRTVYHVFIVVFILLFMNTLIYDLVDKGSINLGFGLIRYSFGKMWTVLYIWTCTQAAALLAHPLLRLWAKCRHSLVQSGGYMIVRVWDIFCLCMFVTFQLTLLVLPFAAVLKYNLPNVSSFIIFLETIRFVMKIHSYVRSVSPRALEDPAADILLPPFSSYLYFLFAPTLIYRDSYPRTQHTRWGFVAARLFEIVVIIFYKSFLYQRYFISIFSHVGKVDEVLEAKQIVALVFGSMLPSLMIFVSSFYLLLHCWLNATAEMLTFADRQFYLDWWNQSNYTSFFRTWNAVIHDWLYAYIYMDVLILTGNRLFSTLLVFTVSAFIHEIVLSFTFRFFYPVILVLFGVIGVMFVFLTKRSNSRAGNIFLWWSLIVGNGVMFSLYFVEYYARKNCPASEGAWSWVALVPRSWSCINITYPEISQYSKTSI